MQLQPLILFGTLGLFLLVGGEAAHGDAVYGVGDGSKTGGTSELYQITNYSTSPAALDIGNTGVLMTDMAISPSASHPFYAISFSDLYTLNPTTGSATMVGGFGTAGTHAGLNSLVFDPSGDLYAWGTTDKTLYKINTSTGTATAIGNTGFASYGDLAWDTANNSLLGTTTSNQLIDINPNTGAATLIGTMSITGDAYGLIIDSSGAAYVGAEQSSSHNVWIYSVNTSNADTTLVGKITTTEGLDGMAVVPEPGGALLVLVGGTVLLVRRPRLGVA